MTILDFAPVFADWHQLLKGFFLTVILTVVSVVVGFFLSIVFGWAKVYGIKPVRLLLDIYIEVIRNTPFIVQVFFIFFGLPAIGIRLDPLIAGFIALTINLSAYACEIVRAGIENIAKGQIEAAKSLALSPKQTFIHVILPPALAQTWNSIVGQIVITMLLSAICSQISVEELSASANIIASDTYRNFEAYIVVTIVYLIVAIALREFLQWLGNKYILRG